MSAAGEQRLEQVQRRRVGPLQVVEEEDQRMVRAWRRPGGSSGRPGGSGSGSRPVPARAPAAGGRGCAAISGTTSASTAAPAAERFGQPRPPGGDLRLVLGEQLLNQLPEGLEQRAVGNPDDLVELARDEVAPPARRAACTARGSASSCRSRSSPRPASSWLGPASDPLERGHQLGRAGARARRAAAGTQEAVADVAPARRPAGRARDCAFPLRLPPGRDPPRQPRRRSGSAPRPPWPAASSRCRRAARDAPAGARAGTAGVLAMWPWISSSGSPRLERQAAGQQLVERHAQRVEVGAIVDVAVHPAGLLGRQVRERALEHAGVPELLMLGRQPRGDAEVDERDRSRAPDRPGCCWD